MHADEDLMFDARVVAKSTGGRRREEILELIDDYTLACRLSNGPDASRALHWDGKAKESAEKLLRITGAKISR